MKLSLEYRRECVSLDYNQSHNLYWQLAQLNSTSGSNSIESVDDRNSINAAADGGSSNKDMAHFF